MIRTLAVLLCLLLALVVLSAPAVAAPTFDFSLLVGFGDGADLGAALDVQLVAKPPGASVGGLWADIGLVGGLGSDKDFGPYTGLSTSISRTENPIITGVGGGYDWRNERWLLVFRKKL